MKKFKFKKIDAFATTRSQGNPAAAIYLDSKNDISEHEMQRIAWQLKSYVNEVGYLHYSEKDIITFRYFSSEKEVDFCGHATIAIMYDLISNNVDLKKQSSITIDTPKGLLSVINKISDEEAIYIGAPFPETIELNATRDDIAKSLNIDGSSIEGSIPLSIINAGLKTLLVPIRKLESILQISPDIDILKDFCLSNGIDVINVFTSETAHAQNSYRTRVFAPTFGYLEDPATGSGNSALAYYLLKNNLWQGEPMTIEQNSHKDNANHINIITENIDSSKIQVFFGGQAIVRIEGEYNYV